MGVILIKALAASRLGHVQGRRGRIRRTRGPKSIPAGVDWVIRIDDSILQNIQSTFSHEYNRVLETSICFPGSDSKVFRDLHCYIFEPLVDRCSAMHKQPHFPSSLSSTASWHQATWTTSTRTADRRSKAKSTLREASVIIISLRVFYSRHEEARLKMDFCKTAQPSC